MKICPKCKHLSAELNHYTNLIVCYNRACGFEENEKNTSQRNKLNTRAGNSSGKRSLKL